MIKNAMLQLLTFNLMHNAHTSDLGRGKNNSGRRSRGGTPIKKLTFLVRVLSVER